MNNLTVDRFHFQKWLEGELLHFENGKGFIIKETECQLAEEALLKGEEVYCKDGQRLTGTKIIYQDGIFKEVLI